MPGWGGRRIGAGRPTMRERLLRTHAVTCIRCRVVCLPEYANPGVKETYLCLPCKVEMEVTHADTEREE